MQTIIVLFMFVGMFLIMQGMYEQRLAALEKNVRVEYRFIPRTYYEEQLGSPDLSNKIKSMYDNVNLPSSTVDRFKRAE